MAKVLLFADEAGNFDFSLNQGATKYFVLGTVTLPSPHVGHDLLELRRDLAWQGVALDSTFHATTDAQQVRDAVFELLGQHDFRIDATIFEKRKTQPHIQARPEYLYKLAWHLHFKYIAPRILGLGDELLVVAASIGTKKRRRAIKAGIQDVVDQHSPTESWQVAFWPSKSDPCLQIADYCTWAIQRKWEMNDTRSYDLIKARVATEFHAFDSGTTYYY